MFYPWRRSLSPSELRKVNRKRQPRRAPRNHFVPYLERLESRDCPSTILNVSKMLDNQSDATIAINPANPQQMFIASTSFHGGYDGGSYYAGGNDPPLTNGLFFAYSSNGGTSWTTDVMATGTDLGTDDHEPGYGLPAAGHFPHAAFDQYGNLFLTYVTDRVLFNGSGLVQYSNGTWTLTDNNAHWFPNEWTTVTSATGGPTFQNTINIGPGSRGVPPLFTITNNTTNTLTIQNPVGLTGGTTYSYQIWTDNPNQDHGYWANSIEVVQSIDGGTFSHQLDYPQSQQNFSLLTSLGKFPNDPPGLLLNPLVATGPGFYGKAFAGLSTGGNTLTTLNDTSQSWSTNQFAGWVVTITEGTGAGQTQTISSNTSSTLTVPSNWATIPDNTSSFEIAPLTGMSTGGNSSTTLNDANQHWITNQFATELVRIYQGTGARQTRSIASNTGTQLTVTSAWSTIPDSTSQYEVAPVSGTSTGSVTGTSTGGNTSSTLNDTHQNWITNQFATQLVRIISGTGAGQTRTIASNTATQLTVTSAWSTIPDATSTYDVGSDTPTTLNDTNQSRTSNFLRW